jgi:thiol-disulfide isomerase/thioredoxin
MHLPQFPRRNFLTLLGLGATSTAVSTLSAGLRPQLAKAQLTQSQFAQSQTASPLIGKSLVEFQGIQAWLNSNPLQTMDLKGKVVLLQFWTFGCINCQRTLPSLVQWHQRYATKGLQVIGVHTPEFAYEREIGNIKQALQRFQITYPVPVDNQLKTWIAYGNRYWPRLYLADRQGVIRYDHIGEGAYDKTETLIQRLLG